MSRHSLFVVLCCLGAVACGAPDRTFLINAENSSPILQIATPRGDAQCASRELRFSIESGNDIRLDVCDDGRCTDTALAGLTFRDRRGTVNPTNLRLGSGNVSEGPVVPSEGPDGLLWLCKEDDDAMECICIPWFQD